MTRSNLSSLALIATSLTALACGGGGRPAPTTPAEAPPAPTIDADYADALADALVAVLATMAQITTASDCQVMGSQLGALFDRSASLFEQTRAVEDDPEGARLVKAAMDLRAKRVEPLVLAMGPGLVRCRDDASVVAAMARMPTL